ncbi:hypothetical protein ACTXK7_19265 [Vreelandella alkaliphila]|uniref:hypothetical protein n=1 Tax=Vreelandella alkaliphila TaxID=272774 RepID=UPI003FD720CA
MNEQENYQQHDDVETTVSPLQRLKGSVHEYRQPFEPAGISDWESALLDDLTPEAAHADELATPTMRELGQEPSDKR